MHDFINLILSYIKPFLLFKILCYVKYTSHVYSIFNNEINHNKMNDDNIIY